MRAQVLEPISYPLPPTSLHQNSDSFASCKPITISYQAYKHTKVSLLHKPVNSTNYAAILDSCACPNLGKQIHADTVKSGFNGHEFVDTKLLQMYCRYGYLEDAKLLFDVMPQRNLYSWTAIIGLFVDLELLDKAILLFQELQCEDVPLGFFVFPIVFKISSGLGDSELGRQLHGIVLKYQLISNLYVGNALIDMYGKLNNIGDATKIFETMPERDRVSWNSIVTASAANGMVYEALEFMEKMMCFDDPLTPNLVTWTAIITGFTQYGYAEEAIDHFFRMQQQGLKPNARTMASVLPACARLHALRLGKQFHGYITRCGFMLNNYVVNGLVDVYRKCSDMESAFKLFSGNSVKSAFSCNTMIVGFCENGHVSNARELFEQMEIMGIEKDIISWNSMISGYVDSVQYYEALSLFIDLLLKTEIEINSFTLGSALAACANTTWLRQGKEMHSYAIKKALQSNTFVGGALVEMYCKCEDIVSAQQAFDEVIVRDTATWNALISGYSRCNKIEKIQNLVYKMRQDGLEPNIYTWNGILAGHVENDHHDTAMHLFSELWTLNLSPDVYTIGIVLQACTKSVSIERGKQVHAHSIKRDYDLNMHVRVALIDMYAKCGSLKYAHLAYNRIINPDLVSHNAMLTAYAMHGCGEKGIALFRKLVAHGIKPDDVTFLSVLSSCVHAGSVEICREFFDLMKYYNVTPSLKHYTCMVDLLSRAGKLSEAFELIKKVPTKSDSVMWGALLGGCVVHGDVELGEIAGNKVIELEPNVSGNYVIMANLYACAGKWSDAQTTRRRMKDLGLLKSPGKSWIEEKHETHVFLACDRSHKRSEEIYAVLNSLSSQMKTWSDTVV